MAYMTHYQMPQFLLFPKTTTYPPDLFRRVRNPKALSTLVAKLWLTLKIQQHLFMISSCTKVLLSRCKCFSWRWKMTLQGSCKRWRFAQGWCMRRKTSTGRSGWWCSLDIEGRSTGKRSTICAPNTSWNQDFEDFNTDSFNILLFKSLVLNSTSCNFHVFCHSDPCKCNYCIGTGRDSLHRWLLKWSMVPLGRFHPRMAEKSRRVQEVSYACWLT